jgi:hypothetical protein
MTPSQGPCNPEENQGLVLILSPWCNAPFDASNPIKLRVRRYKSLKDAVQATWLAECVRRSQNRSHRADSIDARRERLAKIGTHLVSFKRKPTNMLL